MSLPVGIAAPHGATAAEWAEKWFGGPTRPKVTKTTVGTASAVLLEANPRRIFWRIRNRSAGNVYIELDAPAVVATSELLGPAGGAASMSVQQDGEAVAHEIRAIADLAASPVWVYEVIRV